MTQSLSIFNNHDHDFNLFMINDLTTVIKDQIDSSFDVLEVMY